ncbi:MAG: hypothetical protein IJW34_00955, partial [Clostridia bacterium]|nr:hypothetical protein [Clostridia bacterium]
EKSLMNLSEGKELFIGNRQNGDRPYRKTFPYPQKMQAFFAFRSGLHHSRKFDARRDVVMFGATAAPFRASQPNGLGCSEVTKSAQSF